MNDLYEAFFLQALEKRSKKGNRRALLQKDTSLIDLSSNDYLGFAQSKDLCDQIQFEYTKSINKNQHLSILGSTGSRLLTGNRDYIESLEAEIAKFHRAESCLIYNSGYAANVGLLSCIASSEDCFIIDAQVHASTREGIRLTGAKKLTFAHNDLNQLETQLKRALKLSQKIYVCVESLYSMSGQIAPLKEVCELADRYSARLIVDEAHATGVLGPEGAGQVVGQGLEKSIFARVHTFGKALGVYGAAVLGSSLLRDYLLNFSKPFIYSTALLFYNYVSIRCAYQRVKKAQEERNSLRRLIQYYQVKAQTLAYPIKGAKSVIQFIPIQNTKSIDVLSKKLQQVGLDVRGIKMPTVRRGGEGFRICLHAFNNENHIDLLFHQLQQKKFETWAA